MAKLYTLCFFVLLCAGPAPLWAQAHSTPTHDVNVVTQADELIYHTKHNWVTLKGNARVAYQNDILSADEILYDRDAGILRAQGDVQLHRKDGTLIRAQSITINHTLQDGIIIAPALLLPSDDGRVVASKGYKQGDKTVFLNATYTSCMVCPDKNILIPKWKLTAQYLIHEQDTKTLSSTNTIFHILDVPVLYAPYLRQPDPSVKRRSGFLIPKGQTTRNLGLVITIPYFLSLSPRADFTFSPQFTTQKGVLFQGTWRHTISHNTFRGAYWLDGAGIWSADRYAGEDAFEGSFFGKGRFEKGQNLRLGFDLQITSNNSFLAYYNITKRTELVNHAFLEFKDNEHSLLAETYLFRNLLNTVQRAPVVGPSVIYSYRPQFPILGGKLALDSSFTSFHRPRGISTHRFAAGFSWDYLTQDPLGGVYVLFIEPRGKIYRIINNTPTEQQDSWEMLFLPTVGLDWRLPLVRFIRNDNYLILEPRTQVIYAPGGGNPSSIPNEDSRNLDFNAPHLFSRNRFAGLDLWENGFRTNIGLKASYFHATGWSGSLEFGQVLRLKDNPLFDEESGLRDRTSDYVSTLELFFPGTIGFIGRLRLDRSDLSPRHVDLTSTIDLGPMKTEVTYVKTRLPSVTQQEAQEAIYLTNAITIKEHWAIEADWRYDLQRSQTLHYGGRLSYTDDCIGIEIGARQSRIRFRNIREGWSVSFRLKLR